MGRPPPSCWGKGGGGVEAYDGAEVSCDEGQGVGVLLRLPPIASGPVLGRGVVVARWFGGGAASQGPPGPSFMARGAASELGGKDDKDPGAVDERFQECIAPGAAPPPCPPHLPALSSILPGGRMSGV